MSTPMRTVHLASPAASAAERNDNQLRLRLGVLHDACATAANDIDRFLSRPQPIERLRDIAENLRAALDQALR